MIINRRIKTYFIILSTCVFSMMFVLGQNRFIFNKYMHTFETVDDNSGKPACEQQINNSNVNIFYYSFVGCQLNYNISKAIHPGVNLIGDRSINKGDIILNKEYDFDNLADKNKEFLQFMCDNSYWNKYDYFVKIDEDAILDYTNIIDPSYDLGCIWHNQDNPFCTGMVIYSSDLLKESCKDMSLLNNFRKHDDLQITNWLMLGLRNLNKTNATCSLKSKTIIHKQYNSRRLNLFFTPYIICTK